MLQIHPGQLLKTAEIPFSETALYSHIARGDSPVTLDMRVNVVKANSLGSEVARLVDANLKNPLY